MTRRSGAAYIFWDKGRGARYLRFRHVDSLGRAHWPRERSPHPGSRRQSLTWAANRRLAIVQEIEDELRAVPPEPEPVVTLRQVMDAYERDAVARDTRWADEKPRAEVIVKTFGQTTPAMELTPKRVATWRAELATLRGRPLTNRSLNAYTTILHAALAYAASPEVGILPANPLAGLKRLAEARREPPALSDRQVRAILEALDAWEARETSPNLPPWARSRVPLRTRVLLGYWTGGRPEALDRLTWSRFDLGRGILRYSSKGHAGIVVPLEAALLAHLRALRRAHRPDPGDLLMPGDTGGPVVNWRLAWQRLVAIANQDLKGRGRISEGTPMHVLRHSRITHLLQARVPAQVVAQVTGTSLAMLQRHYAHLLAEPIEEEMRRARRAPVLRRLASLGGQKGGQTIRLKTPSQARRGKSVRQPKSSQVN